MGEIFHLDTKLSSYIFCVLPSGHLEHLYYGKKVQKSHDYSALVQKVAVEKPNSVVYHKDFPQLVLDDLCLEYSSIGKGDFRESPIEIWNDDGSFVSDFIFKEVRSYQGKQPIPGMPSSKSAECESLEIDLVDEHVGVTLTLFYHVFDEANVITRYVRVTNQGQEKLKIKRVMSLQLDLPTQNLRMVTFNGAWSREMHNFEREVGPGVLMNDSKTGTSSNRHNPFMILKAPNTTEDAGDCYGFNLVYSGNHCEIVEGSPFGKTRVLTGVNPFGFQWNVEKGDTFYTPEALLSFSNDGLNGLSQNMHGFVNQHIVPSQFQGKARPVLVNNWEATYFDFSERKLLKLAKEAAEVGVELFVLDDGWFGKRNDDKTSLGDWFVNEKKLPSGLSGVSQRVNELGLDFGVWVEPEMVSVDSELYRAHPEWAIQVPGRVPSEGRNQLVLDLTRQDVCDYLVEKLSVVFRSGNITYVKWDMNRNFSDMYGSMLGVGMQGEFYHRYVLGLYGILERLTSAFPDILFEGCASGGNRFDLGMLSYMPQIWTSDDTDASMRVKIQRGTSYGYPLSTMGAHVSDCPNHQTLRNTSIETRFDVAAFGLLGYELNIGELSSYEKKAVAEQIAFYKEYRDVFQFGTFYRLETGDENKTSWQVVSADKKRSIVMLYQNLQIPNPGGDVIRVNGLLEDMVYRVTNRHTQFNIKMFGSLINAVSPIHIKKDGLVHNVVSNFYRIDGEKEAFECYGDMLMHAGFKPKDPFNGGGHNEDVRVMGDFASRLYIIEAM